MSIEQQLRSAAARGDLGSFLTLARSLPGGLPEAQAVVRSGPVTRVMGSAYVTGSRNGQREARAGSGGRELPELRASGPAFTVHLERAARTCIEEEIRRARWHLGDVETGGVLYSHHHPEPHRVFVCHASGPGRDARHGRTSGRLSSPEVVAAEFPEWLLRAELREAGNWHSHPNSDATPSPDDLRNWASWRRASGVSRNLGLIVTPGELGWSTPRIHGFVTGQASDGRLVTEPATIID